MQVQAQASITYSNIIAANSSGLRKPSKTSLKVSCVVKALFVIAGVSAAVWLSAGLIWGVTAVAICSLLAIGTNCYWSRRHVTKALPQPEIGHKGGVEADLSLKQKPQPDSKAEDEALTASKATDGELDKKRVELLEEKKEAEENKLVVQKQLGSHMIDEIFTDSDSGPVSDDLVKIEISPDHEQELKKLIDQVKKCDQDFLEEIIRIVDERLGIIFAGWFFQFVMNFDFKDYTCIHKDDLISFTHKKGREKTAKLTDLEVDGKRWLNSPPNTTVSISVKKEFSIYFGYDSSLKFEGIQLVSSKKWTPMSAVCDLKQIVFNAKTNEVTMIRGAASLLVEPMVAKGIRDDENRDFAISDDTLQFIYPSRDPNAPLPSPFFK